MTKKDFRAAMERGLGRCVVAARENPEKYRDIVLWGCSQNFAYDAQCEGTRAYFVYELVCCYEDRTDFIQAAARALERYKPGPGWTMLHLCELLGYLAEDGSSEARSAIEKKFRWLLADIRGRSRRRTSIFYEVDDLESLCVAFCTNEETTLFVAEELGRLYLEKSFLYDGEFSWLFSCLADKYLPKLKKMAKGSAEIAYFLSKELPYYEEQERKRKERKEQRSMFPPQKEQLAEKIEEYISKGLLRVASRLLRRLDDPKVTARYAQAYLSAEALENRARMLGLFSVCPYPGECAPVLLDTESDCRELAEAAWGALEHIADGDIKAFAKAYLEAHFPKGEFSDQALCVYMQGYEAADEPFVLQALQALPVDRYGDSGWHGVHSTVLEVLENRPQIKPARLMEYLYETTRCTCCRRNVLEEMGKRRMLPTAILTECRYDASDDIRSLAMKRLRRRKNTGKA